MWGAIELFRIVSIPAGSATDYCIALSHIWLVHQQYLIPHIVSPQQWMIVNGMFFWLFPLLGASNLSPLVSGTRPRSHGQVVTASSRSTTRKRSRPCPKAPTPSWHWHLTFSSEVTAILMKFQKALKYRHLSRGVFRRLVGNLLT